MANESAAGGTAPLREHHVPSNTGTVGMWLFLASLTMLFAASMLAYIIIRITRREEVPLGVVSMPLLFWLSTVVVLAGSLTIQLAVNSIRAEKQQAFRIMVVITAVLSLLFVVLQTPAMLDLLRSHGRAMDDNIFVYGLVFVFVLLHALHVLGGLVALGIVTYNGLRGRYDHEHYAPVKHSAMYWHFLDVVWIFMFGTMLVLG